MNIDLFERLLYEEESPTLDFKREQYRFSKAPEDEKSELLKDILGFANAWRRSEAYILVGVEEIRGGRANVMGIPATAHLDDHSLQQFVNNLTNQPVRFHYEAFGFHGKQIGVIKIDEQTRPIYLKRDYGRLAKEKVYVRRGSATDPSKPASPEEIAQMRVGAGQPVAEVLVEFAHIDRDDALGKSISWDVEFCVMPSMKDIPDLKRPRQSNPWGIDSAINHADLTNPRNQHFFRELANFEFVRRLFKPVRLVVRNIGQAAAMNVWAEIMIPRDIGVTVMDASEIPELPRRRRNLWDTSILRGLKQSSCYPGEVDIDRNDERFRIEIDCGDLQPGRRVWSDIFHVGKRDSGALTLAGLTFADNLPQPKEFALTVLIDVKETSMGIEQLCALSYEGDEED